MSQFIASLRILSGFILLTAGLVSAQQSDSEQAMLRQGLVDVQQIDQAILVELKYATTDNFVGRAVYGGLRRAYLQPLAARKLALANAFLREQRPHLRLLIYDAARPRSAQWNLWNALPQYRETVRRIYVADPRLGSIHNYGCAVDVTLAELGVSTKKWVPLDMGTKFDYFGPLAYPVQETRLLRSGQLTRQQVDNRILLRSVMRRAGFSAIDYEWWHFNALSRNQAKARFRIVE